jgi:oxidase EvaA
MVLANDSFPEETPPGYIWMTLGQLQYFVTLNNYVNVEARSLLAAVRQQ